MSTELIGAGRLRQLWELIGTGGCWPWWGRIYRARAWHGSRLAYRVVYEELIGTCPPGVAHHRCLHGWCVNPFHLEFITRTEHAIEHGLGGGDLQLAKTQCPQGHEYDEQNTYRTKAGHRKCRKCMAKQKREWEASHR